MCPPHGNQNSPIACSSVRFPRRPNPGLFSVGRTEPAPPGMWATSPTSMSDTHSGMAYFVLGSDQTLSRLGKLTDPSRTCTPMSAAFLLRNDEKYCRAFPGECGHEYDRGAGCAGGQGHATGTSQSLLPARFKDFQPVYLRARLPSGDAPAEYHTLDLVSGVKPACPCRPRWLTWCRSWIDRTATNPCFSTARPWWFFGRDDHQARRTVMRFDRRTQQVCRRTCLSPGFSPMVSISCTSTPSPRRCPSGIRTGLCWFRIFGWSTNPWSTHPARFSTRACRWLRATTSSSLSTTDAGASVILVFWANVVRDSSDLYFANHETGELKVVGNAIGRVTVDAQRIIGTVNMSAQDATGDLVVQDVEDSEPNAGARGDRILRRGRPEPDRADESGLVAYTVRGRVPNDHDACGRPL